MYISCEKLEFELFGVQQIDNTALYANVQGKALRELQRNLVSDLLAENIDLSGNYFDIYSYT